MACAPNCRSYRQYPQEQNQQLEFKIPLNHQTKTIFVLTVLLPIACYFLVRGCEHWDLKVSSLGLWHATFRMVVGLLLFAGSLLWVALAYYVVQLALLGRATRVTLRIEQR